ncbi:MAG: hypothetical protein GY795_00535 [Desulfobacterales bacterium]|nr:hypothetical protein [Desulfobacterales bacterium]
MKCGSYVPNGSYRETSHNIKVILSADCIRRDGTVNTDTLDITNLNNADIANIDGKLVNKATDSSQQAVDGSYVPKGSYQDTSSNITVTLSADCIRRDETVNTDMLDITSIC